MAQPPAPVVFLEQSIGPCRVDRANGILYGVKVCGLKSKNGRRYTEAALKRAVKLYENAKVNLDHIRPGEACPLDKRFGHLFEVHWKDTPTPGLYGNLKFPPDHSKAAEICSRAEHTPNDLGMSHRASAGEVSYDRGEPVVESITEVESVDLVADPATVGGLFEEVTPPKGKPMKRAVKALLESCAQWPFQKSLVQEMKNDPTLAGALAIEIETADDAAPAALAEAAFSSLAANLIATGGTDRAAKLDTLVKRQAKFLGEEVTTPKVETATTTPEAPKAIGALAAARLCEQLEFKPTAAQLALLAEEVEGKARAFAEEFARIALSRPETKPQSGAREQTVAEEVKPKPLSTKELAARIG